MVCDRTALVTIQPKVFHVITAVSLATIVITFVTLLLETDRTRSCTWFGFALAEEAVAAIRSDKTSAELADNYDLHVFQIQARKNFLEEKAALASVHAST